MNFNAFDLIVHIFDDLINLPGDIIGGACQSQLLFIHIVGENIKRIKDRFVLIDLQVLFDSLFGKLMDRCQC